MNDEYGNFMVFGNYNRAKNPIFYITAMAALFTLKLEAQLEEYALKCFPVDWR